MVKRYGKACGIAVAAITMAGLLWLTGSPLLAEEEDRQAELDEAFIETLSGSALVGSFTVTGEEEMELREERYEITEVEKIRDGFFLFRVRIQYGDRDVEVAAPLVVIWSGDTPVITLTNAGLPGLGRYTARVLIYEDHYAGYWSAGDHGGHLFGVIEPLEAEGEGDGAEGEGEQNL